VLTLADRPTPCEASPAALACWALREELTTWPKPGLVSPIDRGSHDDMDASLFEESIASLADYFEAIYAAGRAGAGLNEMRALGIAAEARMLRATRGVNTHRGAIFTLGLLLAAAGRRDSAKRLGAIVRETWGPEISQVEPSQPDSHGLRAARRYNIAGARGQAAGGFPHIYHVGLPALRSARRAGWNLARVQCVFVLVAHLDDTNLLHRGGEPGLEFARSRARDFLDAGGILRPDGLERAANVHREFVARRLSPGGAGDLLAATIFVDAVDTHAGG
jgi:triphosphoribosyl-dephospho-CoA synthase